MKKLFYISAGIVLALYIVPCAYHIIYQRSETIDVQSATIADSTQVISENTAEVSVSQSTAAFDIPETITVQVDGKAVKMDLEDYILGVVCAEISNEFPLESIKAQAVAARTYALSKISRGRSDVHPDSDVCDDFHHCAAYKDYAVAVSSGEGDLSNIQKAVKETEGQILTYDGSPITAVFHCASAPKTESAADVWGSDIPYLQSVVSPGGTAYEGYESAVTFSADEFRSLVKDTFPTADLSGEPASWFCDSSRSDAGGIITVSLGGIKVKGTDVRDMCQLKSTNFTITTTADSITFHTIGYGHGVGLSQYGAKYLAESGMEYDEILLHYYPGTVLQTIN